MKTYDEQVLNLLEDRPHKNAEIRKALGRRAEFVDNLLQSLKRRGLIRYDKSQKGWCLVRPA